MLRKKNSEVSNRLAEISEKIVSQPSALPEKTGGIHLPKIQQRLSEVKQNSFYFCHQTTLSCLKSRFAIFQRFLDSNYIW